MSYCSNCGFETTIQSNFCSNCGEKTIIGDKQPLNDPLLYKVTNEYLFEGRYILLEEKLLELIAKSGFLIVAVGDLFVQFLIEMDHKSIVFDLGLESNLPENIISEIYKLGFSNQNGAINKSISLNNRKKVVLSIVKQTKYIFEELFNSKSVEPFAFTEVYDRKQDLITSQKKVIAPASSPEKLIVEEATQQSSPKNISTKAIFFIIFFIIVIIGYFFKSNSSSVNDNVAKQEIVYNSPYDASVSQVESYLKQQYLKDPDSYESISWSKVQTIDDSPNYKYMVRNKFRAKNGFGGYNVENKVFYLDKEGNVVDVKDFNL